MAKLELPPHPDLALKILETRAQERERGMIGYVFGSRRNAPTNIGGAVAILAMLALIAVSFINVPDPSVRSDLMKIFGGIVFAALGYVFGSISGGSSKDQNT